MSGRKRGTWRLVHDPTPTQLADLRRFVCRQDAWLDRNGPFIKRYLGEEALDRAEEARDDVEAHIESGDPDSGFEAYGAAWDLFNALHRQAIKAKRHEQRQRQREAETLVAECARVWEAGESQALLRRWIDVGERQRLAETLPAFGAGPTRQLTRRAERWLQAFEAVVREAERRDAANAEAAQECIPALQSAIKTVSQVNVSLLAQTDRGRFAAENERLQGLAEDALSNKALQPLQRAIRDLSNLATDYERKVRAAQLARAGDVWRTALADCGYAVTIRSESDGTIVLQAGRFPMRSVNVKLNPETDEVKLDIDGTQDTSRCVKDVQALQAELKRYGLQLTMTDWGKGTPQAAERRLARKVSVGGPQ